MVFIYISTV